MGVFQILHRNLQVITVSPEQDNLWSRVCTFANILDIVPLYYTDAIAGSEFLTYAANKLYVALNLEVSYSLSSAVTNPALLTIYDQANAVCFYGVNTKPVWDTLVPEVKYCENNYLKTDFYFSRIAVTIFNYIHFNGYRIDC